MISFNFAKQITDYLFATSNFQLRRRRMTCVLDNINLELKGGKSEYEDENKLVPIQKRDKAGYYFSIFPLDLHQSLARRHTPCACDVQRRDQAAFA